MVQQEQHLVGHLLGGKPVSVQVLRKHSIPMSDAALLGAPLLPHQVSLLDVDVATRQSLAYDLDRCNEANVDDIRLEFRDPAPHLLQVRRIRKRHRDNHVTAHLRHHLNTADNDPPPENEILKILHRPPRPFASTLQDIPDHLRIKEGGMRKTFRDKTCDGRFSDPESTVEQNHH